MSVRIARFSVAAAALVAVAQLSAQGTAASALPPIRPLGKVTSTSTELLGAVSQVRALPGGRVLVNDNLGRRVVLFEPGLNAYKVVADTTSATANAYSSRAGGLIAFKGDSTLFVDPVSLSMLVIDGKGNVARVISVPRPNEAQALIGGPNGTPGFDAQGRLVYRAPPNFRIAGAAPGAAGAASGFQMPQFPESVAVVRIALDTRKIDTVAFIKIPKQNMTMTQSADGRMSVSTTINPMPVVDDWAVTADGRVAVVRGQEYRIDWVDGSGAVAASNKIPFAWRKLDDSSKTAFIDSTRSAMEKLREQAMARAQRGGAGAAPIAPGPGGAAAEIGAMAGMRFEVMSRGDGGGRGAAPGASAGGPPPSGGPTNITIPPLNFVQPSELPDYAPPFSAGAVRGDYDGNVWIRTSNMYSGGSVYDVVNAKGELTDRVLLPAGRVIAGFGPGVVYMGYRESPAGVRLEMAPVRGATP